MKQARTYFSMLSGKNIFKPKVLAKVSLNSFFVVGCSISVSSFLRPLCLHNRIAKFNCRLREAIVLDKPLSPGDEKDKWSSSAFMRSRGYTEPKNPCRNCQVMFQNLNGFITTKEEQGNRDTFQGACAEYFPVNKLINAQGTPADSVSKKLQNNWRKCMDLFRGYGKIVHACNACDNIEQLQILHIFGYKPDLKM